MAKEGLIIKGIYKLEAYTRRQARRAINAYRKWKNPPPDPAAPNPTAPNYYMGRPHKPESSCSASNNTCS